MVLLVCSNESMQLRHQVFAYGSNLDREQMGLRCPSSRLIGPARLARHRLAFTRYSTAWQGGVADVIIDPSSEVWGLVWSIAHDEIATLDEFELVPRGYDRKLLPVRTTSGHDLDAWTYQVVSKKDHVSPPERYLEIILRACDEHGFPRSHRRAVQQAARGSRLRSISA